MKILLAGAGGQLGRQIHKQAAPGRHEIVALSRRDLDIENLAAARAAAAAHRPDIILNAAAFNDVDRAESDQDAAYRGNAVGPRNLAIAAASVGAQILHVSTDYVFDGRKGVPYHEYDIPMPLSQYGKSKLAGEIAVRGLVQRHYIVRTAWVFEPDGNNFPKTLYFLAMKHKEVKVVDDVKGSPTSAAHLAAGILRLIETGAFGTWHLAGSGEGASWCDLARAFFEELKSPVAITPVPSTAYPRPAPRPAFSTLRTIQQPEILLPPWQDGVREFAREIHARFGGLAR